jgi:hypothetical protein
MGIDFDAIRRKVAQLSGNNRGSSFWRPDEGEHTVRLVPYSDNDGQPFKERWFYYNVGENRGILAPKQFGKPDPIQELINKLRDDGTTESMELCKRLYPKMRGYAPVVVRGEESKGVQLWSFGKMVYQDILNIMLDPDYGDITDPSEGRDIKVTLSKQPGQNWAKTTVMPRGKVTDLASDPKQIKTFLENIPNLDEIYSLESYEEIEKKVNDWLNGSADSDEGTTRGTTTTTTTMASPASTMTNTGDDTSTPKSENAETKSYNSLDDAFADLLGE